MPKRPKINPLFFAPFVSSVFRVEPGWIDNNGHLNMAYYNVLFDRALDETISLIGVTPDYIAEGEGTVFVAEAHLAYRREVLLDTPVRITVQLVDYDAKRMHTFLEMRHASEGWLAASAEFMLLHVDGANRKVAPFPADVFEALAMMHSAHIALPKPEALGRVMGIPKSAKDGKVGLH